MYNICNEQVDNEEEGQEEREGIKGRKKYLYNRCLKTNFISFNKIACGGRVQVSFLGALGERPNSFLFHIKFSM